MDKLLPPLVKESKMEILSNKKLNDLYFNEMNVRFNRLYNLLTQTSRSLESLESTEKDYFIRREGLRLEGLKPDQYVLIEEHELKLFKKDLINCLEFIGEML